MKKTGLVLTLTALLVAVTVCATGSADAASGTESSFPSASEIFSTVEWPDYTFDTFMDDAKVVFSAETWGQIAGYIGDIGSFLTQETFLSEPGSIGAESFSGDEGYVNLFVVACIAIALICILGAVIAYISNRKTFWKNRKTV